MATGKTALVTGASSGIGEQIARQLAAKGNDLVLVARNKDALERLAEDIERAHGTKSEIIVADLGDRAQLEVVETRVRVGSPIDTVVNNAGFGFYGTFSELPLEGQVGQIEVNILALTVLSHAALATMVPKGSGNLLNVASIGGFAPSPLSAVYSATKGYVLMFSEALHDEAKASGVHVTAVCPGLTKTEFQNRAGLPARKMPSWAWSSAESVARQALHALERNQALCVPGVFNKITAISPRFTPRPVVRRVSQQVMKRLEA